MSVESGESAFNVSRSVVMFKSPFEPVYYDLNPTFRLTDYADLKGWGCKIPEKVLKKLLQGLTDQHRPSDVSDPQFKLPNSLGKLNHRTKLVCHLLG